MPHIGRIEFGEKPPNRRVIARSVSRSPKYTAGSKYHRLAGYAGVIARPQIAVQKRRRGSMAGKQLRCRRHGRAAECLELPCKTIACGKFKLESQSRAADKNPPSLSPGDWSAAWLQSCCRAPSRARRPAPGAAAQVSGRGVVRCQARAFAVQPLQHEETVGPGRTLCQNPGNAHRLR